MGDCSEEENCARSDTEVTTPKNAALKRPRGSPTVCTPHREQKRVPLREILAASNDLEPGGPEPRRLTYKNVNVKEKWCNDELKALVEFILFHSSGELWPSHKQEVFWNSTGEFVKERSGSSQCRSGMLLYNICLYIYIGFVLASTCHSKVVGSLMKQYKTPKEAETAYFGCQSSSQPVSTKRVRTQSCSTQTELPDASNVEHLCKGLPLDSQLQLLSSLFSSFVSLKIGISVPNDYLEYSASAMANLRHNARSNVLYNLAKGWGTMRTDGSDSRFPIKRMPMGLIEYAASFFSHDHLQSVSRYFVTLCI